MKLLYLILALDIGLLLWANAEESSVRVVSCPVVILTVETNHVYTLWETKRLGDPWKPTPTFENVVVSNETERVIIYRPLSESAGFFWLQLDGESMTNAPTANTNTNGGGGTVEHPPIP